MEVEGPSRRLEALVIAQIDLCFIRAIGTIEWNLCAIISKPLRAIRATGMIGMYPTLHLFPDQNSLLSLTHSKCRRAAVILTPPYLWKKSKNMNAYTINFAWIAKISSYGWIAGKKLGKSFRLLQTKRKISTPISAIAIDPKPSLIPSGGKILNSDPGLAQYTQAIGAIKWKQWIAQIAYTLFRAIGAIGAIGAIKWKPGLRNQGDDEDDNDVK